MGEFRMPSLGADMDQGTLVEWRVGPGDHVRRGDIVATVDTDKAVIDVEVFEDGVVAELLVEPGATVPVGTPLALITAGGPATPTEPVAPGPPVPATPPVEVPTGPLAGGRGHHHASVLLSPVVRHLAERLHVDPDRIDGSGPGGRVTRADVEAVAARRPDRRAVSPRARRAAQRAGVDLAAVPADPAGVVHERDVLAAAHAAPPAMAPAPPATAPAPPATAPSPRPAADRLASSRRATARGMERSNREIPHYHLTATVDLAAALDWLRLRNADRPPAEQLVPAALLLRATAVAAGAEPDVNGWWIDGDLRRAEGVDLGVAVSLRAGGLVTPTIVDADTLGPDELMAALRGLVERARHGALRSSELSQASITVTNLGDRGADSVHGVIHPPQVALVGFGRVAVRPVVVDGAVVPRPTVIATMAGDHRASDGRVGSRFLHRVEQLLAHPDRLDPA